MTNPKTLLSRIVATSVCVLALGTAACSSLLEVDVPSRVPADDAFVPENAGILMNSVIGEFECAFGVAVASGGLLGDELANASTGNTQWQVDRRDMQTSSTINTGGCGALGPFGSFSVVNWLSSRFRESLEGWTDAQVTNRRALLARNAAYQAYAYLLLGEQMCSATVNVGPELTKAQLFGLADERFTVAIAEGGATNQADVRDMALVGRARTRLNLGNRTGAATDARLVPAGFVKNATFSAADARRFNPVFNNNNRGAAVTVGPVYRDMRFNGVRDPRVNVTNGNRLGQNQVDALWLQGKYTALDSPIPLARWEEAQLIIAEAELEAGNLPAAVTIINALHARTTPALAPFASTSATEIRAQLVYERRAELFLESHHLNDYQRFTLPFAPAPGAPFPLGGGFYGSQRCFLIPDLERTTNPNLTRG